MSTPAITDGGAWTEATAGTSSPSVAAGVSGGGDGVLPAAGSALLIASAPVLVLSLLSGVVGNTLVCASVYRNRGLRNANNALLVNLAVADLVVCLTGIPLMFLGVLNGLSPAGACRPLPELLCPVQTFFHVSSSSVQLTTLVAVSMERYEAIVRPFETKAKRRRVVAGICVSWGLALVIAVPAAALLKRSSMFLLCSCRLGDRPVDYVHVVILAPLGVTCLMLVVVFYLRIFRTVRQHVQDKGKKPGPAAARPKPAAARPKAWPVTFLAGLKCAGCCRRRTNTVGVADTDPHPPGLDFSPPSASPEGRGGVAGRPFVQTGGGLVDDNSRHRAVESDRTEVASLGESPARDSGRERQMLAVAPSSSSSSGSSLTPDTGVGSSMTALPSAWSRGERAGTMPAPSATGRGDGPRELLVAVTPATPTDLGGSVTNGANEATADSTGPVSGPAADADRKDGVITGASAAGGGGVGGAGAGGEHQGSVCVLNPALRVRGRRNLEAKTAKRASYIIGVFGLCWLPLFVTAYLEVGIGGDVLAASVAAASAALNPVVYTVVNKAFRKEFAKMLRDLAARCPVRRWPRCCGWLRKPR